jgi:hypothetical protein
VVGILKTYTTPKSQENLQLVGLWIPGTKSVPAKLVRARVFHGAAQSGFDRHLEKRGLR